MWYAKHLITFGLINGGIFLLGTTAFIFDDDVMGSLFAKVFIGGLITTSIWLGITLKRGKKASPEIRQGKEAI